MPFFQKSRNRSHFLQIFLQPADHCFLCERHKLDDKSPCLLHSIVLFHQYAQTYRRWYLLAGSKVVGKVLCDLAGLEYGLPYIRLFHTHVLDHVHKAHAYGTCHIQFSLGIGVKDHIGISHISLYVSLGICSNSNALQRTSRLDLQGQQVLLSFHHHAHHGSRRKQTAKSRRSHRAGIMRCSGILHQIPGSSRECPDLIISRCGPYNIISHILNLLFIS